MPQKSDLCLALNAICYDRPQWASILLEKLQHLKDIPFLLEKLLYFSIVSCATRDLYLKRARCYDHNLYKNALLENQVSYITLEDAK